MNPLYVINFLLDNNFHIVAIAIPVVWYLHKIHLSTQMTNQNVEHVTETTVRHEQRLNCHGERLDDHGVRIAQAETKLCLLDTKRCDG